MKLAMGCDPAAYRFYQKLLERMRDEGYDIIDIGCESEQEADGGKYAEIAEIVSNKVVNRECDYGIVLCTGAWFMEKKGIDFTMAMIHAWLFSGYTGTHEDGMQALSRLDHKKYQEVM